MPRGLWILGLAAAFVVGCGSNNPDSTAGQTAHTEEPAAPRSVILIIGDGMGPQQLGLLLDWAAAADRAPTALERLMNSGTTGYIRTASIDSPATDSAAAATAIACGVAEKNQVVAMTQDGRPIPTAMEDAIASGRKTGLVTTTRVTHATPACFITHIDHRDKEEEIAVQIVDSKVDLILGGGAQYFLSQRQNLRDQIAKRGWRLVEDMETLGEVQNTDRVLGLFAKSHLPYVLDRDQPGEETAPTLAELTEKALQHLGPSSTGFFLMIEGGRIDHAAHANDVAGILGEMREFDDAVAVAMDYQRKNPSTLLLLTADHETGGLCVTYGDGDDVLTDEHILAMTRAKNSVEIAIEKNELKLGPLDPSVFGVGRTKFYSPAYYASNYTGLKESAKYKVSFGTGNHSTTPVPVIARGPGATLFGGLHRNTWIGQHLRKWMQRPVKPGG